MKPQKLFNLQCYKTKYLGTNLIKDMHNLYTTTAAESDKKDLKNRHTTWSYFKVILSESGLTQKSIIVRLHLH